MPKVIGGLAALVALAAGLLSEVDPATCLTRGAGSFLVGWFGTQCWYVFFAARVQPGSRTVASDEDDDQLEEARAA